MVCLHLFSLYVPPFISDQLLTQSLSRYGKLVSPIQIGSIIKTYSLI